MELLTVGILAVFKLVLFLVFVQPGFLPGILFNLHLCTTKVQHSVLNSLIHLCMFALPMRS